MISRCVSKRKISEKIKKKISHERTSFYKFHFIGYYLGQKIKIIHLYLPDGNSSNNNEEKQLTKGEDYLLWVKCLRVNNEILEVKLIKYKKLYNF